MSKKNILPLPPVPQYWGGASEEIGNSDGKFLSAEKMAELLEVEKELQELLATIPIPANPLVVEADDVKRPEPATERKTKHNEDDERDPKRANLNESYRKYRRRKVDEAASNSDNLNEKFPYAGDLCERVFKISKKLMVAKDFEGKVRKERAYLNAKDRNYNNNKAVIHEALLEFLNHEDSESLTEEKKRRATNLTVCLGVMMVEQDNIEYVNNSKEAYTVQGVYQDPQTRLYLLKPPCLPSDAEFISRISELLISEKKESSNFSRNYKFSDVFKQQVLTPMLSTIAKDEQNDLSSVLVSFANFRSLFVKNEVAKAKAVPATSINPRDMDRVARASSSQPLFSS